MDLLLPKVEEKLKTLSKEPGVYLMKDKDGQVIYVGKARALNKRVRQYFGAAAQKQSKTAAMVSKVADFNYIITNSEKEALILECNLIKEYRPYYNILLKDDKHYPYVRIDLQQDFPRVEIVRRIKKDGARYFGPYLEAYSVREVMDALYKLFPLRSCTKNIAEGTEERPCLNYQMGRCLAPCAGKISKGDYRRILENVMDFLSGKYKKVEAELKTEMLRASERLEYEHAAALRDKLKILSRITERQIVSFPDLNDKDVFAAVVGEGYGVVQAFFVRKGKLSGARRFFMQDPAGMEELMGSFLKQYYMDKVFFPKKIYVSVVPEEAGLLAEWLTDLAGHKVEILRPQKGDNKKLVMMAGKNAMEALARKTRADKRAYERSTGAAQKVGALLGAGYVRRMECYDISNTQGTDSVASMVVFIDGKPAKSEYRRFRIRTVTGADDFASMAEVLERRLREGYRSEDKTRGFGAVPDLIVVDGGKGQLHSAVGVLESMGMESIHIVGLAKREEEIFVPGREESIVLPKNSPEIGLLTAIRDEAHRFAVTYHRTLREKRTVASVLDNIKGIGKKRRLALIEAFGDIAHIKKASIDELAAVKGIDIRTAREIFKYFS